MLNAADVTYDLVWRDHAGTDHPLASVTHHFDPQPAGFDAVDFQTDLMAPRADAHAGDQLILRFTAQPSAPPATPNEIYYIPNSDGANANGRIPSVRLPL